jgi:hypothetical protein
VKRSPDGPSFLHTYWPHIFGTAVAAAVGVPAAVASYRHGMTVIERSSDPGMAAWLPMTTDGLLVAALVALWVRRLTGRQTGLGPWAAFGLGLVAATATNLAGARSYIERGAGWDVVEAVGWAVWPPVCLAVVLEIVACMVVPDRGQTRPTAGQTTVQPGQTDTGPAVDQRKLTDEEYVEIIRAEGIEPTRKALADRFGMGSTKADRIRGLVETPVRLVKTDETGPGQSATG